MPAEGENVNGNEGALQQSEGHNHENMSHESERSERRWNEAFENFERRWNVGQAPEVVLERLPDGRPLFSAVISTEQPSLGELLSRASASHAISPGTTALVQVADEEMAAALRQELRQQEQEAAAAWRLAQRQREREREARIDHMRQLEAEMDQCIQAQREREARRRGASSEMGDSSEEDSSEMSSLAEEGEPLVVSSADPN